MRGLIDFEKTAADSFRDFDEDIDSADRRAIVDSEGEEERVLVGRPWGWPHGGRTFLAPKSRASRRSLRSFTNYYLRYGVSSFD